MINYYEGSYRKLHPDKVQLSIISDMKTVVTSLCPDGKYPSLLFFIFLMILPTNFLYLLLKPQICLLGKCIPHFPIGPKIKVVKIKNKTGQAKDFIKRLTKHKNSYMEKICPLELTIYKNTKLQGLQIVRNSEQKSKNLLYVVLIS